jgi:hypothetical protein
LIDLIVEHSLLAACNLHFNTLSGFVETAAMMGNVPKYNPRDEKICDKLNPPQLQMDHDTYLDYHN